MNSEINKLLQKVNDQFEFLDFLESFEIDNEIVSLKISLINLLISFNEASEDKEHFFQIILLSTPVMFDFMYNDYIQKENRFLKNTYKKTKYYSQSKKWYKFVRNSLIHTNRYTHNLFTDKIYRIEYESVINILFELDKTNGVRSFDKFLKNRFLQMNFEVLEKKQIKPLMINHGNVKISIDYDEFIRFIYNEVTLFTDLIEKEIDRLILKEVHKWEAYYQLYKELIKDIILTKRIDIKSINKLVESIRTFKKFNNYEVVILVEFLLFIISKEIQLQEENIQDIIDFTAIDVFSQIENRNVIFDEIANSEVSIEVAINYKQVENILVQMGIKEKGVLKIIHNDKYTNYLIIFTKKYFKSKNII